jgi:hypothetical protein
MSVFMLGGGCPIVRPPHVDAKTKTAARFKSDTMTDLGIQVKGGPRISKHVRVGYGRHFQILLDLENFFIGVLRPFLSIQRF